jgi:NTE family protein
MALARSLAVLAAILIAACSTPPRTTPLASVRPAQYGWPGDANSDPHTLFVVTASGGGQRAAALALGALRVLDAITLDGGRTLLDEVDIISSVSGGSVTAAYFALRGREGFDELERAFIRPSGNAAILGEMLDPGSLAALIGSGYTRLDLVADYLRETLFGDATYADLVGRRPYLIVNAADMAASSTFPFTQPWFDLLCAELTAMPIAEAVAASAAVPVVFAPLSVANQAPCDQQFAPGGLVADAPTLPAWARWIREGLDFARHGSIERLRRARVALTYLNLDCDADGRCTPVPAERRKTWVHLLDGSLVDYLGLTEPFRLMSTQEVAPYFLPEIVSGRITRIVVVVVSARIDNQLDIDQSGDVPGLFATLRATATSPINAGSLGLVARLLSLVEQGATDYRDELVRYGRVVFKDEELRNLAVPEAAAAVDRIGLIIDFELIDDPECRRAFNAIATSWTITPRQVGALIHVAGPLLAANPDFARMVEEMGGRMPPLETVADSCNRLVN